MLHGNISNKAAPTVAFNCAAMFEVSEGKLSSFFTQTGLTKLGVNKYAASALSQLMSISCNRLLIVEKPNLWKPVQRWIDGIPPFAPTYVFPVFYADHYATLRGQYRDIVLTLWCGEGAPGYDEVVESPEIGEGWSMLLDAVKHLG